VQKLQGEVSERDSVLADLNLRVIEGEMTRVKLSEMEQEIRSLKSASNGNEDERSSGKGDGDSFLLSKMRKSLSPSTAQKTVEMGDRTTVAEASNRDMEIRLAKALSEQESLKTELDKEIEARTELQQELVQSRATVRRLEDAEKERGVVGQLDRQRSRVEEELRTQLELVSKRERSLHANLAQVESQLEQAQQQSTEQQSKISTLEEQARQAQQWRDEAQQASVRANELEGQVEDFESQVDEFERQLNSVNDQRNMLERAVRDLRTVQQADEAELGRLASEVDSAERARESDAEANEGVVLGLRRGLEEEREGRQEAERLIEQLQTQCEDLISKGHEVGRL
jgi:chromosome segregation ATPase